MNCSTWSPQPWPAAGSCRSPSIWVKPARTRSAIIGNSRAMQAIYKEIGRVAATSATVLIRGATGTGKELIARAIYQHSDRADKPFIAVNCAAIPDALLESELFGHERGAFTGAQARRIGRFEQAHGGTLFLDEIGDLNANTQAKLLRVLQERCIQRLGSEADIAVDVRVLAATHRDLEGAIQEKEFREDLFYRLSVVTITLPSLAKRAEDIPHLARYFIQRYARELGLEAPPSSLKPLPFCKASPGPATCGNWKMWCDRPCCWPSLLPSASNMRGRSWPGRHNPPPPPNRPMRPASRNCWRARNGAKSMTLTRA